jgi:hypothetical protein
VSEGCPRYLRIDAPPIGFVASAERMTPTDQESRVAKFEQRPSRHFFAHREFFAYLASGLENPFVPVVSFVSAFKPVLDLAEHQ